MNTQQQSCVAVFATHTQAEDAIRKLEESGFDMTSFPLSDTSITPTSMLSDTTTRVIA